MGGNYSTPALNQIPLPVLQQVLEVIFNFPQRTSTRSRHRKRRNLRHQQREENAQQQKSNVKSKRLFNGDCGSPKDRASNLFYFSTFFYFLFLSMKQIH